MLWSSIWFIVIIQIQWCSGKFSLVGTLAWHYGHISYRYRGGGGGGFMNELSRVKIHVQTWGGGNFEIMERYCIVTYIPLALSCVTYSAVQIIFEGMLFRENLYDIVQLDAFYRVYFDIIM